MSDWIILFLTIFLLIMGMRVTVLQAEVYKLEDNGPKSSPDGKSNPTYKNGDWMVQMKKPKKEIVISECFTEGEVVRKIILMGHRPHEIKEITQLWV